MSDPRPKLFLVVPQPKHESLPGVGILQPPLTDDELLALVDGCQTDDHRWLAYRAVTEIKEMRRQLDEDGD